jgi:hypothetical protein
MRVRLAALSLVGLVLALQASVVAGQNASPARSPRNASYTLQATLDPATHTLVGAGRLTWRNVSHSPATELRFHLYWNAWRNSASSWLREAQLGSNASLAGRSAEDWGWIDLTTLADGRPGGSDLLPRARFIAPDDGNGDDRTVVAVPLDRPIEPGATITVLLGWTSHVPRTFARTGVIGDYYFFGQWFPKIGVLEDTGWNCHQFHATTEFFADFGTYDASLTVPSGWMVGATGREQVATDTGHGTTTHRYLAEDVHDFAWTTSPDFVDLHAAFNEPGLPPVDMRLLLQPEHLEQAERHFTATRTALKDYGAWFGPYPYGYITVVDPVTIFNRAAQGGTTGGMEYPTLFTAGTRWFAPWQGLQPESVTIHEAGHQFWYGMVATNEFEHAWMDEGLNTYSQGRAIAESLPPKYVVERFFGGLAAWAYEDERWSRLIDGDRLNSYRGAPTSDVPSTPSWRYWPETAGAITYDKTALWLDTLERYLGWPTMQKILTTYFARGVFRHPMPDEFFAIASEVSGQDLTWYFDAVYRSSAVFDYSVGQVTSVAAGPRGWVGEGASARFAPGGGGRIDSTVVVRRLGDGVFPVDVRVTFDDGAVTTEKWDGRDRWHQFRYRRAAPVRTVEVDPNRVLLLDVNYTNNSWTRRSQAGAAAHKWSVRWLTWLEELLLTYAFYS